MPWRISVPSSPDSGVARPDWKERKRESVEDEEEREREGLLSSAKTTPFSHFPSSSSSSFCLMMSFWSRVSPPGTLRKKRKGEGKEEEVGFLSSPRARTVICQIKREKGRGGE